AMRFFRESRGGAGHGWRGRRIEHSVAARQQRRHTSKNHKNHNMAVRDHRGVSSVSVMMCKRRVRGFELVGTPGRSHYHVVRTAHKITQALGALKSRRMRIRRVWKATGRT